MRKQLMTVALLSAFSTLPFASSAFAGDTTKPAPKENKLAEERFDHKFVRTGGTDAKQIEEVSRVAKDRTKNAKILDYAKGSIDSDKKLTAEFAELGKKLNITPSKDLTKAERTNRDRLLKLKDAEFDKAYVEELTTRENALVTLFERAAKDSDSADIKAFATAHLDTAKADLKALALLVPTNAKT